VSGWRHSRIRYSKPGSSTIGIGSGDAGATAPTTIFAASGMNGDVAGIGAVTMRKILLGLAATAAIAVFAVAGPASAAQPTTTTANIALDVKSEVPTGLPALNSQFTKMVLTPSGVNHWNFGDDEHTTSYNANGVEQANFPYTQGHVVWNGVEYAPLVGEGTQVGGVLYRIDGGPWQALNQPTTIDGNGKVVHVEVVINDRPGNYDDNTGAMRPNTRHRRSPRPTRVGGLLHFSVGARETEHPGRDV
jgi:hypothetical protein